MLSQEQVKKLIQSKSTIVHPYIDEARRQENRLFFHLVAETDNPTADQSNKIESYMVPNHKGCQEFREWVVSKYHKNMAASILLNVRNPISSTSLTQGIKNKLRRATQGEGSGMYVNFDTSDQEVSFRDRLLEINDSEFWQGQFFDLTAENPHAFIVLDYENNLPYYYVVPVEYILSAPVVNKATHEAVHILFQDLANDKRFIYIDSEYYAAYLLNDGVPTLEFERPHGLGFTPAAQITHKDKTSVNAESGCFLKTGYFTAELAKLDSYVLLSAQQEANIDAVAFPRTWAYNGTSIDEEESGGGGLDYGDVNYANDGYSDDNGSELFYKNPAKNHRIDAKGPGVRYAVALENNDMQSVIPPMGFVAPPVGAVESTEKLKDARAAEIEALVAGRTTENREAINELQVKAGVEDRQVILQGIADDMSITRSWTYQGIAKMMGIQGAVNYTYGHTFFAPSTGSMIEEIDKAKKAGLPQYVIDILQDKLTEVSLKRSPSEKTRYDIIKDLEPLNLSGIDLAAATQGALTPEELYIKANLINLIARFERENGDITRFGTEVSYYQKIQTIQKTLLTYVKDTSFPNEGEDN